MAKQYWLALLFTFLVLGVLVMPKVRDGLFERKKKLLMAEYARHSNMTSDAIDKKIETRLGSARKFYNVLFIMTWGIILCFVAYITLIVWVVSLYSRW